MNSSIENNFEYFCIFLFKFWMIFGEISCLFLFCYLLIFVGIYGKLFCAIYIIYFMFDYKRAFDANSRKSNFFFNCFSKSFRNYFSIKIIKTCDLPSDKNYIIAAFPHGIMAFGAFANFTASENQEFSKLFPNINVTFCSTDYHFLIPFFRDIYLLWGMRRVSKAAVLKILSKKSEQSNAAVIAVGGHNEMKYAAPNSHKIFLKNRKGFVKIALQTGSDLVPSYTFGENDLFDPITPESNPHLWKINKFLPLPLSQNFMPKRCRLMTVIGKPIQAEKIKNPTKQEVDDLHDKFCREIEELFEKFKSVYYGMDYKNYKLDIV